MLSSGGEESATSLEMSPVVLVVVLLAGLALEKRDILVEVVLHSVRLRGR